MQNNQNDKTDVTKTVLKVTKEIVTKTAKTMTKESTKEEVV